MSDWQPPDAVLVARFGAALPAGTEPRRMFGCPCAFAAGKLCAGVYGSGLILRLPAARRAELLAQPGVQPFVAQGRSMREYVLIDAAALPPDAAGLSAYIAEAAAFAASLPDRPKRARPSRKPAPA